MVLRFHAAFGLNDRRVQCQLARSVWEPPSVSPTLLQFCRNVCIGDGALHLPHIVVRSAATPKECRRSHRTVGSGPFRFRDRNRLRHQFHAVAVRREYVDDGPIARLRLRLLFRVLNDPLDGARVAGGHLVPRLGIRGLALERRCFDASNIRRVAELLLRTALGEVSSQR